jgi:dipeptidyl aminopeptidase/acylaminoacyl peptidase
MKSHYLLRSIAAVSALAGSLLLSSTLVAQAADDVLKPNANLYVENIPPIPKSIADSLARYNDFRGHGFAAWHPKKREMIVAHREKNASFAQLFWLRSPMGKLEAITKHSDPISGVTIDPIDGNFIVFESSKGGSEVFQLFRQSLDGKAAVQLTDSNFRHSRGAWRKVNDKHTGEFIVSSVPLDKNLTEEQKKNIGITFRLMNPMQPEKARTITELPGTGWFNGGFHPSGNSVILNRYISANESEIWTLDINTGKHEQILPLPGGEKGVYLGGRFSKDGKAIFLGSDRSGEFRELVHFDLARKKFTSLTQGLPHDVDGSSEDDDDDTGSSLIFVRLNVKGRSELRAYDSETKKEVQLKGVPDGTVVSANPRRGGDEFAVAVTSAKSPSDIHVVNQKTGESVQWTRAESAMDTSAFKPQEIITWKSFDGREISGLINRAPAKFPGKRPVLVNIHGGPEAQARISFQGRWNYFMNELGVTMIQPNVRGSSGFGKTFLTLDNGFKREDSVKDIGALFDWIATQPDLDASKVIVMGGSYGGYMSLAVSTNYPDRIAGAIDIVGISNFVTFLETTESYRRDLRRVEYGDEREPKMREFLIAISPLTNAHKIKKPLFVIQGKNDPRVPVTEAEQIVAKARANKSPVWYLRGENEGHGFARRENAEFQMAAMVKFLQETVLK